MIARQRSGAVFCRLEALPAETPCVSVIVVAGRDLAALHRTLASIALQTLTPLDVTIAIEAGDAEQGRAMAMASLPPSLTTKVAAHDLDCTAWKLLPRLIDDGAGAAIAILGAGDLLAPGFLAAALARFAAADGDSIAAVAVRSPRQAGTAVRNVDGDELPIHDILGQAESRAACFIYRREAIERVGGLAPELPVTAARWDLHLRLAVEWRIGLLPECLAAKAEATAAEDQSGVAAFRSMQLRRTLRQSPGQLGLLLSLAQARE